MRDDYTPALPKPPKKKRRLRRLIVFAAIFFVVLAAIGVIFSDDEIFSGGNESLLGELHKEGETWAVYWYLCGSDLESGGGFASGDLAELCQVTLPDNVQVIIETGGSYEWEDPRVNPDKQCRFLYSGNQLQLLEEKPAANMSDGKTLAAFLQFCRESYPADHEAVVLWDHGGGSVGGVIYDERYDTDCISLPDLRRALAAAYAPSETNPPLDMIGFDACLMAAVETAAAMKGIARYMVASEETEPGCGWNYTGFFQALAEQPRLNGARLGKAICDSYAAGCNMASAAGDITLSCVDLTRIEPLLAAWHNVGVEALAAACENPNSLGIYARSADNAKQYGPNQRSSGYTGMLDLGDLVRGAAQLLPNTNASIAAALEACVVYKINGPYRMNNAGLAAYYPLGLEADALAAYSLVSVSQAHDYLYEFLIAGRLSQAGAQYARSMEYVEVSDLPAPAPPQVTALNDNDLPATPGIAALDLEDFPVVLDSDNNATLELGSDNADQLMGVYFELAYYDEQEEYLLFLGRDNDLEADWESGTFKDNFWGYWGAIDGHIVYMDLVQESDEYDLYDVPILLNGAACSLRVAYVWETERFEILGARRSLNENGLADKELILLRPGDEITTLHYFMELSGGGDDVYQYEIDTFTVTGSTAFAYEYLWDGDFIFFFDMVDACGASAYSEMVTFTVEDEEIYVELE